MIILHPFQQQLKNDIYSSWNRGNRFVMAQLPTGGGKSIIVSDIAYDFHCDNSQQVIIAHRNELVSQMSLHVARRGIPHRIIGSNDTIRQIIHAHREEFGESFIHPKAKCNVAGIDTINARIDDLREWAKQIRFWTVDEGHHLLRDNKWGRGTEIFTNAFGLGVSASPGRPDGKGLGADNDGIYQDIVFGPDMRWLINNGYLTDYEIVCPESDLKLEDDDITDSGDYSPKKLKVAAEKSRIVGDVVREYVKHALFKRAICFATDVETANKIANRFNEAGIRAAAVSAKTPTNVREKYIREFKNGQIFVLVNVDLFDEGFDVPACECVIMARPTASIVKYLQMFGRALRTMPGKQYGLIIDHVSNWLRHGLPDKPRIWTLNRRDKRGKQEKDPDDIPLTRCLNPDCGKPYERFRPCCPHCGYTPPLPEPMSRTIEMVDGDLILLDRATLEAKRKAMQLESPESVASRVAFVMGNGIGAYQADKQREKIQAHQRASNAIAQWAGIQRAKGRADSESYRRFYITMGIDVLEALSADKTKEDYENLAIRVEGWYK